MEIQTALTDRRSSFLVWALSPYAELISFFVVKVFFIGLEVEEDAMGIFPLLMPLSTLSPVKINSVKPEEEQPTNKLKKGPDKVPINMSMCSLSVNGGWTLLERYLHFWHTL